MLHYLDWHAKGLQEKQETEVYPYRYSIMKSSEGMGKTLYSKLNNIKKWKGEFR